MRLNLRRTAVFLCMVSFVLSLLAQAPAGYYSNSKGKSGAALKTALYGIISNHKERSYSQLWEDFGQTDLRADGKIWDMYSNITNYVWRKDQAGQYHGEGDVYNREHSFPKSWFSDGHPMYTDLFHLYPTDGYVNSMRSNYPFGETKNPDKTSKNGYSKLGPSSTPGYSGTVFEPNDEYKGDFARTYFYMATAYEGRFASFHSPMLAGNKYPGYKKWAIDMLLRWAKEDPVSEKEIKRNNAVYKIQQNRNPYIDYPGLEQYVWGDKTSTAFDPDNYDPNTGGGEVNPDPQPNVEKPAFSIASGVVAPGTEVTISCSTKGAYIYYTVNGGDLKVNIAPVTYTINENVTIEAYAMVGEQKSETVQATYTIGQEPPTGNNIYVKVSQPSDLVINANYLIVCEEHHVAMGGYLNGKNDVRSGQDVTISGTSIETEVGQDNLPYEFTLGGNAEGYTFYDAVKKAYLGLTADNNKLHTIEQNTGDNTRWTISISNKGTDITHVKYSGRDIMYNASSPRFATYNQSQQKVVLYKKTVESHIEYVEAENGMVDVYTLDGRLFFKHISKDKAVQRLPKGLYIVGGVKMIIK